MPKNITPHVHIGVDWEEDKDISAGTLIYNGTPVKCYGFDFVFGTHETEQEAKTRVLKRAIREARDEELGREFVQLYIGSF